MSNSERFTIWLASSLINVGWMSFVEPVGPGRFFWACAAAALGMLLYAGIKALFLPAVRWSRKRDDEIKAR